MLIPYATDAPIYHFPFATIGLIVVNTAVFAATAAAMNPDGVDPSVQRWMLEFGAIAPWQWLTTNFLHADLMHLVGNMVFLWAFGIVVEGKLGWWRFLLVYLLIGIVYGGLIQVGMYSFSDGEGLALGASAAIFGVIGLAVAWAPQNDMRCVTWFVGPRFFEVSILVLGLIYLGLELLQWGLQGFQMSSELLHITGLFVGFPLGLLMVRCKWVDCEGWDLFSVLAGSPGRKRKPAESAKEQQVVPEEAAALLRRRRLAVQAIRDAAVAGKPQVAATLFARQAALFDASHPVPDEVLRAVVHGLHTDRQWEASIPLMKQMLIQSSEPLTAVRLKLAQILLQASHKPASALRMLKGLPPQLSEPQARLRERIRQAAVRALDEGAGDLEIADDDPS